MDHKTIFSFFTSCAEDFDKSYESMYESMCLNLGGINISYNQFITLTESLIPELNSFDIMDGIHLFHDNTIIHKINYIVSTIGIDNLLQLYLIYDYLLMDLVYFNKISKMLISYFNFNEDLYRSCNEKIKILLNNVYKNEIIVDLFVYIKDYSIDNITKKEKYDRIEDDAIKNRTLTQNELSCIITKLNHYSGASYDDCYFDYFDEECDYENTENYVFNDKINKVEYVINKFCNKQNLENVYFIPHPDESKILRKLIDVNNYFTMIKKIKEEINIEDYNLCGINYRSNDADFILIALNKFMKDSTLFCKKRQIMYVKLAGLCKNLDLVKQIVKYYNLHNLKKYPYNVSFIGAFPKEIKKYLIDVKFVCCKC